MQSPPPAAANANPLSPIKGSLHAQQFNAAAAAAAASYAQAEQPIQRGKGHGQWDPFDKNLPPPRSPPAPPPGRHLAQTPLAGEQQTRSTVDGVRAAIPTLALGTPPPRPQPREPVSTQSTAAIAPSPPVHPPQPGDVQPPPQNRSRSPPSQSLTLHPKRTTSATAPEPPPVPPPPLPYNPSPERRPPYNPSPKQKPSSTTASPYKSLPPTTQLVVADRGPLDVVPTTSPNQPRISRSQFFPRAVSTPSSRRQHADALENLHKSLQSEVPGPGSYTQGDIATSFGRSSKFEDGGASSRGSPWARSTSSRMEPLPKERTDPSQATYPGQYDADHHTIACTASAKSSPSVQSQRGMGIHSSNPAARLGPRTPFHQGLAEKSGTVHTPGPGAYNPNLSDPRSLSSLEGQSKKGLAGIGFRSKTEQHNPGEKYEHGPPPGHYTADLTTSSIGGKSAKSGDAANLIFASKQERFIVDPTTTSEDIGPGTYNADSGEKAAQLRSPGGKVGAHSYPFSSTDRRYRSHQMAPNENDIWEADLQFAAQSGQ